MTNEKISLLLKHFHENFLFSFFFLNLSYEMQNDAFDASWRFNGLRLNFKGIICVLFLVPLLSAPLPSPGIPDISVWGAHEEAGAIFWIQSFSSFTFISLCFNSIYTTNFKCDFSSFSDKFYGVKTSCACSSREETILMDGGFLWGVNILDWILL